jgi:hypothetical protein
MNKHKWAEKGYPVLDQGRVFRTEAVSAKNAAAG